MLLKEREKEKNVYIYISFALEEDSNWTETYVGHLLLNYTHYYEPHRLRFVSSLIPFFTLNLVYISILFYSNIIFPMKTILSSTNYIFNDRQIRQSDTVR